MITDAIRAKGEIGIEEFYNITYACFNEVIFKEANANKEYILDFIKTSEHFRDNSFVQSLYKLVFNVDYLSLTDTIIEGELASQNFNKAEITDRMNKIKQARKLNEDEVTLIRHRLKVLCSQGYLRTLVRYQDSPDVYQEKVKQFDYKSNLDEELPVLTLRSKKPEDIDEELDKGVESSFDFINKAFARGKYYMKQIVCVTAPPGTGKSMFLQQEAIHFAKQGKKVHLMILGDQTEDMVFVRLVALATNTPLYKVNRDFGHYLKMVDPKILDNLYFTVKDSYEVLVSTYIEFVTSGKIKDVDILMIDYDKNFVQETDDMYQQGLLVYNSLTKPKNLGKLIFIATQPKQAFFNAPELDMTAPGESSGKMHVVDMLITIGIDRDEKNKMGFMKIAKMRNGDGPTVNKAIPWAMCDSGRLAELSPTQYEELLHSEGYVRLNWDTVRKERLMEQELANAEKEKAEKSEGPAGNADVLQEAFDAAEEQRKKEEAEDPSKAQQAVDTSEFDKQNKDILNVMGTGEKK